jgi:CTP:molybdopterin cytidylyltransferase MocA
MEGQQLVAAVVLAAGESRRFGGAKQLAELDGRTLLEHVLALADEAGRNERTRQALERLLIN